MSIKEFIQDIKDMAKRKDITVVKEKYLKPAYNASKRAVETGWHFVVVNTPKAIDAGKDALAKGKDAIDKMRAKKGEGKTETIQKTEVKTEVKTEKTENKSDHNNNPTTKI